MEVRAPSVSLSFLQLLQRLEQQHLEELQELHLENLRLEGLAAVSKTAPGFPGIDHEISQQVHQVHAPETGHESKTEDKSKDPELLRMVPREQLEEIQVEVDPPTGHPEQTAPATNGLATADEDAEESSSSSEEKEPVYQRMSLAQLLESELNDIAVSILILTNVLVMMVEFQFVGDLNGYEIKYRDFPDPDESWGPWAQPTLLAVNAAYTAIFALELIVRVAVLRMRYWRSFFNWLDFLVVLVSVVELILDATGADVNMKMVRMLRLARIVRALRIIRTSTALESLNILLRSIQASTRILFWSLCLISIIQCIGAILLMQVLQAYFSSDALIDERHEVFAYFGTLWQTTLTMFEVLFANWITPCRVMVNNVSPWFALVFVCYRCVVGFAVLNVINAVFIQQTMKFAQADQDLVIRLKEKAAKGYAKKLGVLFSTLDESGDGHLSFEEFERLLSDPKLLHFMSMLDVEAHDLRGLFDLLDDGNGLIAAEEFSNGVLRIKGPAKSVDIATVLAMTRKIENRLDSIEHALNPGAITPPRSPRRSARPAVLHDSPEMARETTTFSA